MADRVFHPGPIVDGRAVIEGDEARHLARVRRAGVGDRVELFDGRGVAFEAEVVALGRDRVEVVILGPGPAEPGRTRILTLATAVPKGDRFDWLVEKATELGVDRIVPLVTARSVVDPRGSKLERLRRLIVEASKQCGRNRLMQLDEPRPWSEFAAEPAAGESSWMAHPGSASNLLGNPSAARVRLAIGPEGGFDGEEVAMAGRAGWVGVDLGPTILRVETAGLVGSALLLAERVDQVH